MPPDIEIWKQDDKVFSVFEIIGDRARGICRASWVDVDANVWREQLGMEKAVCTYHSEKKPLLK